MEVSKHFDLREFVPSDIWEGYGENAKWFIDIRVFQSMEYIRSIFDAPITINNWHTGGTFQNRGFRHPLSTVGARLSQHKFGRAIDFNVEGITSTAVFNTLKSEWSKIAANTWFTTMEDPAIATTWTHIDMRHTGSKQLLIVKP